ncbi:hypothetical protein KDH83_28475, partial [Achromobacter sp. Marseille-Q0513]|uniref:hypothetical protein n=1 Tax=Achromobacter sp. Marseille-Q0513 TaxID=2829161 RepID=UPI001B967F5E
MSTLIVPVDLTAYCIGTLDAAGPARAFAGGSTDYSNQVSRDRPAFLGLNVSRDPSQAPLWPMEQGVHLHWAMPDALTRAPQGDALRFPALPNRWLVSRIAPDALTSRHWIVQSDLLSDTPPAAGHAPTVPVAVAAANGQPTQRGFRFLGATQVFDAGWSDPAPAANAARGLRAQTGADLHAVATGDIAFAAFYPNSRGVFGFHDDLTDLNPGPDGVALLYTVTGWYADPTQDPLRGAPTLAQLQQTLGWTCASADPKADRSLYNGLIQGLVWNPHTRYVDDAPTPIDGDVAIGNHPAEALAAYFRGLNSPATPIYEELLTLYATGLLPGLSAPAPGQLALLEETLHALQFSAQDAGTIYTVTRDDAEAIDLPLPLADALNQLNLLRLAADASAVQVRQARWQLFSAWLRLFSVDSGNQQAALSAFSSQFALQGAIDRHQREADDAVAAQAAAVRALLGSELTLTTAPAPSYRGPAEPVLLLAGDAAAPALRYGGDGRYHPSGYLPCRLADAVLDTVSIGPSTTLRAASYAPLAPPAPNRLPDPAVGALVLEAALLCTVIGARASGLAPAALAADLTAWTESGAARYYASAQGLPPSAVGVGAWPGANPWCSLAVLWQGHYHPLLATAQAGAAVDYPPRYFTANYLLDPNAPGAIAYQPGADGIHIDPASIDFDSRDPASGTHLYQGLSILSAASADNLRNQLARDLARQPDATLQTIADQLAATDISMQSMTGLNDQLLSRRRSLQLSIGVSAT